ncbi:MAG: alpha-E domain-containing protein [Haliscomenobacter sp.]
MLARIANSLYWTGRYIERAEHLARYMRVQYFSTQDAPISQPRDFGLFSIANMAGLDLEEGQVPDETELLFQLALDTENPYSIFYCVHAARENARGMRNVISTELWEVINKFYHFVNDYPVAFYKTRGLFDFTVLAGQHGAIIRGYLDSTLVHNEAWALIRLGIHLERAAQIARIISCKLYDIFLLSEQGEDLPAVNYQYTVLLKVLESFDMNRQFYKAAPDRRRALEFLILNTEFPRSIAFNLRQIQYFLNKLGMKSKGPQSPGFQLGRLYARHQYLLYPEIAEDPGAFVSETLGQLYTLHESLEKEYFHSV